MLDDDKPDYFLSDNSKQPPAGDNRVIDFGPSADGEHPAESADSQSDGHSHGKGHSKLRRVLVWTAVVGVAVLAAAFYLRYCSPYAVDATTTAYVVNVEKRGIIFKTYEAQVVTADAIADTSRIYSHPEQFTVADEKTAHELQTFQARRLPVTLRYEKFYATLPWRGSSKCVITSIETGH